MTLPPAVAAGVNRFLGARVVREQPVGGGCIHHGTRVDTDAGATFFLKWNDAILVDVFEAEADGLRALRASGTLRAPEPLAWGDAGGGAWLLLEYVPMGRAAADTAERLGRGLAALHTSATESSFGWRRDNWIGSLRQANAPVSRRADYSEVPNVSALPGASDSSGFADFSDFWRDRRVAPQLELARQHGYLREAAASRTLDRVLDLVAPALADVTRPELVHGDLWGGNWLVADGGEPVLIDPAVYLGHGEVDLAMSELFGGFERSFYDAYEEVHGTARAYRAYRRDLYQLYYLLVHVNLFGAAYEAGALAAARRVVAALSG